MTKNMRWFLLAPLLGLLLLAAAPMDAQAAKAIAITKEVSVDGGVTWHDAETADQGPGTAMGAQYRLTVEACGLCPLVNAVVTDNTLGIEQNIPDPGSTGKFVFTYQDPGFENLDQPRICANPDPAAKQNIAKVTAFTEDGNEVTDENQAWVRCACLDIEKEVSVDGGLTWHDADTMSEAPGSGMGAVYRLRVKNCGGTPVENTTIKDPSLGIEQNIGTLAPMEEKTFTAEMAGFGGLKQPGLCENPDPAAKENVATVSGNSNGTVLSDEDAAWVKCVCIDLEKRVSVDGGNTWLDADTLENGPGTGSGALYQLEVKNCGGVPLTDVMLDDPDLNLSVQVADLAAGESQTFDATTPDFGNLDQPGRCDNLDPPEKQNVATVSAIGAGSPVSATDEAWVKCLCIDVEKEVSVDGGQTWFDADDLDQAPTSAGEAMYRIKVENCGGFPLTDVTVEDPELDLLENIGGLQPGDREVLDRSLEGFEMLLVTDRCLDPNPPAKLNIVEVSANGNGATIFDEDPAWVKCACLDLEKQVSVDGGQTWFDADEPTAAPSTTSAAMYRLQVSNCSDFDLDNVLLSDPDLWINQEIGPLPAGQSRTLTADDAGFEKLDQPGRCQESEPPGPPALANTATATGFIGNASLSVEDSAWVTCTPCTGTIGDFVWNDTDRDGIQDPGEPGILNVTVILRDVTGAEIATTTTTDQGFYQFSGLCAGDYTVEVINPDGFTPSACDQGGDDALDNDCSPEPVTLPTDQSSDSTIDFGFNEPCSGEIGSRVWEDLNNDGIQDAGEPGIVGVPVTLKDGADQVLATTSTGTNGIYGFSGLCTGDYVVEVPTPPGTVPAPCNVGTDDEVDNDCSPAEVNLPDDFTEDDTIDFGFFAAPAMIGDRVWNDLDRDGIQDDGEPGIPGVTVELRDCADFVFEVTTTDAQGNYKFTVNPGDYNLRFVLPDGFQFSPADVGGDDTLDSDAGPDGTTDCTGLVADENDTTWDAGMFQPQATLGDRVWNDEDNDGIQDAGEAGIPNVTVNLLDCQGVPTGMTTTTDAAGNYSFTVDPGQYIVQFVAPGGFIFSPQDQGADDAVDSDANPANGRSPCITLAADENNPTVDAGLFQPQPDIDIEKSTNGEDADTAPGPILPVGSPVTWTYLVTNTGNVPMTGIAVTDDQLDAVTCPQTTLAPGESMTCTAEGTVSEGQYTNEGCVVGTTPGGMQFSDCDTSNYFGARAAIDIEKATNGEDADNAPGPTLPFGTQVTWTYLVINTGNVVLTDVAVTDDQLGAIDCPQATLAPGEAMTCTANGTVAAGQYQNLGTVTGDTPGGMTVSDNDPSHYLGVKPSIDVEKFVSTDGKNWFDADSAPGINVPLCPSGGFSKCDSDSDDDSSGDNYSKDDSSSDESSKYDSRRSRYNDKDDSSMDDSSKDDRSSDDDDHKSGDDDSSDDGKCVDAGDCQSKVFFKFVVTNDGQTLLNNIMLSDSKFNLDKCTIPASLAIGKSFECVIGPIKPMTGQHMNTATAKGDFGGITAMDTDKAHYFGCIGKGTGTPGYWKNHPEAWPVAEITIGGKTYTKAQAIMLMKQPTARDKTYTLIQALIAAKLNVLSCNVSYCIDEFIMKADQWFAKYPVGSGVSGSSSAWKMGEPFYLKLDAYNNGKLCAPSRDAGGSSKDDSSSDDDKRYSKKK